MENNTIFTAYKHLKNLKFASADIRNLYLKYAETCFNSGDFKNSVYFQLEALCFAYNIKYQFEIPNQNVFENYNFILPEIKLEDENLDNSNKLLEFAKEKFISDENENISFEENENLASFPDHQIKEINEIICFNKTLPTQWMVVQICKGYNPNLTISTESEILVSEIPIYFTIIKHPRSPEFLEMAPITIRINYNFNQLYEKFYNIREEFKIVSFFDTKHSNLKKHHEELKLFDNRIENGIEILLKFVGPWMCLFSGNVHQTDKKIQQEVFDEVDQFCKKYHLNDTDKILISLLVSQNNLKYLTEDNCKEAIKQFSVRKNSKKSKIILEFLINRTKRKQYSKPLTPCILIVDELLDHFPWEMLNKSQEIYRISSYNILKQLYNKYKHNMSKGYLKVDVNIGHCVINPENNLPKMQKRLGVFFKYWLPHWSYYSSEVPTAETISEIFSSKGIYVYCGHGSGVTTLDLKSRMKDIKKSVVFLIGCDSIKLRSRGLHSEFYGDHLYFHAGLCPVVVGLIHVGLDYPCDKVLTETLSTWIASDQNLHWKDTNKDLWKKNGKIMAMKTLNNDKVKYEPRLSAILSQIRSDPLQKLHCIASLVYRGLPAWNICL